jgi:two-component system, response regulator YesN
MLVKLIIVEDEINVRNGISNFIKELGHPFNVIGTLSNGAEALEFIKTNLPDILITDIKMPKMDGLSLVKEVKKTYPDIIVVILSGYADFSYATQAIRYGVSDYLLKPINKEVFASTLSRLVSEVNSGSEKYSILLQNQPKWDMRLLSLESQILDCVEMANITGVNEKEQLFYTEIRKRCQNDAIKAIPYYNDFLVSFRKRVIINEEMRSFIEPKIDKSLKSILSKNDLGGIEVNIHELIKSCTYIISQFKKSASPDIVIRCKELMDFNYYKEISLQEVADSIGVSAAHLSRVVKKELGKNFKEYIIDLRIENAKKLLVQTNYKVMDISKTVGYDNAEYFSRIFKRQTGFSPHDYRNQLLSSGDIK